MRQGSVKILRDLCLIARLRGPLLQQYHWPGNVRELENIVERLLVYAATLLGISRTALWRRIKDGAADNGLR